MTQTPDPWVRNTWHLVEHIHAVLYFAPEGREAATALGLTGFWMGYFAFRAAPFGAASPHLVEATFFNFARAPIDQALPAAWSIASPDDVLAARRASAAAALRRLVPTVERDAVRLAGMLEPLIAFTSPHGRPLFAANQALAPSDDPVERLWQATATAREDHRGDGHVAALVAADLDGCEALVLFGADERNPDGEALRGSRQWPVEEWEAATERLRHRNLIDATGGLTADGADLRTSVEAATDVSAARLFVDLAVTPTELTALASPIAQTLRDSATITYPNPMGLPPAE